MADNYLVLKACELGTGNVLAFACPSRQSLQHVTSRGGRLILIALFDGTLRFAELRWRLDGISERMLAQTLQAFEFDRLAMRRAHDVVPPHVDDTLTPLGAEVASRLRTLACRIKDNLAPA